MRNVHTRAAATDMPQDMPVEPAAAAQADATIPEANDAFKELLAGLEGLELRPTPRPRARARRHPSSR